MILLRILVLVFNAAIITYLVFEMIQVARSSMDQTRKTLTIVGGIILLLAPLAIFMRFVPFTFQYLVIYPVAIFLFIYMMRKL